MKKFIEKIEETEHLSSNEEILVKGGIVPFSSFQAEQKDRLLLEDRPICASHVWKLATSIQKEGHVVVPLLLREEENGCNTLVDGYHRLAAVKEMSKEHRVNFIILKINKMLKKIFSLDPPVAGGEGKQCLNGVVGSLRILTESSNDSKSLTSKFAKFYV